MGAPVRRNKLGLALSGGGFRASLFHVGVLRRMAELDLLRYLEVLSTVSGGSIVGALYALLAREALEAAPGGRIEREGYVALTERLERILVGAIRRDLRTRLFCNPLTLLRVMLTRRTLGREMGRLYQRYIYRPVGPGAPSADGAPAPDPLPLRRVRVRPGGKPLPGGIEAYNKEATAASSPGSAVTNIILNATTLNSGARFWFSSSEVGDWYLGHVRHSEIPALCARRLLLALPTGDPGLAFLQGMDAKAAQRADLDTRSASFARWWRQRLAGVPAETPEGWEPLFRAPGFPGALVEPDTSLGQLRQAKLPAWYLRKGGDFRPPVTGGVEQETHRRNFWDAIEVADPGLIRLAFPEPRQPQVEQLLMDFVLELYWFRSAELVSDEVEAFWRDLTLADAVATSACFPPVFSPIVLDRLYDQWHVSRLALSDGGVFDNIGLTGLLDEGCTHIVASDTSGLLGLAERAATGRLGMMARIVNVLMEAVANRERSQLRTERQINRQAGKVATAAAACHLEQLEAWTTLERRHDLKALAFFHIKSSEIGEGLSLGVNRDDLARIRTDLDGFGEVEVHALVNHGYNMADRYLRRYFGDADYPPKPPGGWQPPARPPHYLAGDARTARILRAGRLRFFRALVLGNPVSWAVTLALAGVLVWGTWSRGFTLGGALAGLAAAANQVGRWISTHLPWLADLRVSGGLVVSVVAAIVAVRIAWPLLINRVLRTGPAQAGRRRMARRLAMVGRVAGDYLGNLLWPLAALPLVLAVAGSLLAWMAYFCFYLPFRWSSRNLVRAQERAGAG